VEDARPTCTGSQGGDEGEENQGGVPAPDFIVCDAWLVRCPVIRDKSSLNELDGFGRCGGGVRNRFVGHTGSDYIG
jgi:hypothetical protein